MLGVPLHLHAELCLVNLVAHQARLVIGVPPVPVGVGKETF